ncbi:MAG: hypothetical protein HZA77_02050 [Candidatus Schekmanbacteria bacterium]|nr:hypothetical protein [Candidatus Schekmanbacteria bacterium]
MKKREIPDCNYSRVNYREGGIFSSSREYLRIRRKEYVFDICGAPFGNSFFVSWWLGERVSIIKAILLAIPFVGQLTMRFFKPDTYYKRDTALMFQESVRQSVLEVIDEITKAKGLRSLTENDRKPILSSLFKN